MSLKIKLLKNAGYNLAGYVYLLIASFFSISILLSNLGKDLFGLYLFLASIIPLASVFDFGLSAAMVRNLSITSEKTEEKVSLWQTSMFMFLVLSCLISIITFVITYLVQSNLPIFSIVDTSHKLGISFIISTIIFFNNLNNHFLILPQANHRFDIFNLKTLVVGSTNTIITAFVTYLTTNLSTIFFVQLLAHLVTLIILYRYSRKYFSKDESKPKFDQKSNRKLFTFGIRHFIGTLAGQVEAQFSNYILGWLVSAQAITSFSIPQSIVAKGAGVISQFAQAFFPLSSSLITKDKILKLKKLFISLEAIALLGGFMAVILTYTIGEAFLTLWLKDLSVISAVYPILKILSWYFVLVSLTPIPTSLIQSINKPQVPSFFAVLTVFFEIIFAFIFVPRLHALGMAYAFLYSTLITVPLFLITTWVLFNNEIKKVL